MFYTRQGDPSWEWFQKDNHIKIDKVNASMNVDDYFQWCNLSCIVEPKLPSFSFLFNM